MKNIHLLPTDKPSRLFIIDGKLYNYHKPQQGDGVNEINQHIYITSDEEIKEGDWVFNLKSKGVYSIFILNEVVNYEKKIILTTDQDLIADGVQEIDDNFLEWFVKNPSCDSLEVKKRYSDFTVDPFVGYEIIIPKEEPKQKYEYIGECKGNNDNGCFMDSSGHDCGCFTRISKEEPKFDDSIENSLSIMSIANDMFGKKEELKQELLPDFKITKNIFDFVTDLSDTNKEEPKQDKWEQLRGEGLDQPLTSWDEIKQHVGLINDNIDEFDKAAQEYFERKSKFKQDLNDDIHEAHQTSRAMKQEESKQECTCGVCDNCEEQETIQILKEAKERALKQETLEEAANNFANLLGNKDEIIFGLEENAFIEGAKWQAERMYSEEEVLELLLSRPGPYLTDEEIKEWFEQNKKK